MDYYLNQLKQMSGQTLVQEQVISEGFPVGDDNMRLFEEHYGYLLDMLRGTKNYFDQLKVRAQQGDMGAIKDCVEGEKSIRQVLGQLRHFSAPGE